MPSKKTEAGSCKPPKPSMQTAIQPNKNPKHSTHGNPLSLTHTVPTNYLVKPGREKKGVGEGEKEKAP